MVGHQPAVDAASGVHDPSTLSHVDVDEVSGNGAEFVAESTGHDHDLAGDSNATEESVDREGHASSMFQVQEEWRMHGLLFVQGFVTLVSVAISVAGVWRVCRGSASRSAKDHQQTDVTDAEDDHTVTGNEINGPGVDEHVEAEIVERDVKHPGYSTAKESFNKPWNSTTRSYDSVDIDELDMHEAAQTTAGLTTSDSPGSSSSRSSDGTGSSGRRRRRRRASPSPALRGEASSDGEAAVSDDAEGDASEHSNSDPEASWDIDDDGDQQHVVSEPSGSPARQASPEHEPGRLDGDASLHGEAGSGSDSGPSKVKHVSAASRQRSSAGSPLAESSEAHRSPTE